MAKKGFTDVTIKLCEKECNFKRVTNETLKKFSEKAEKEYNENVKSFVEEVEVLDDKRESLERKIAIKNKQVAMIENKSDVSDEEYDKVYTILDDIEHYEIELETIKQRLLELGNDNPSKEYNKKADELLAEKVETFLEGITATEFIKNSDPTDRIIAQNLEKYYQQAMVSTKESKIRIMIQEDVENFLKQ